MDKTRGTQLQERYDDFIEHRKRVAKAYSEGAKGFPLDAWKRQVDRLEVELRAGGRAVIRDPGEAYWAEVQWVHDKRTRTFSITAVHLFGTGKSNPISLGTVQNFGHYSDAYFAALRLALDKPRESWNIRVPRKRPTIGQPVDLDFYQQVLLVHKELVRQGCPGPAAEIARRMNEKPGTVRGWIHRGRKMVGTQPPASVL